MWISLSAVALVAVLALAWFLRGRLFSDGIDGILESRRATSRLVGRGEYVDGSRHLPVALALTPTTFFYESRDIHASVDLEWIREVEYASALATGSHMPAGKVLRLRSQSQSFEFVLPEENVHRWRLLLPPRDGMTANAVANAG